MSSFAIYPFFLRQAGCAHRCCFCRQPGSVQEGEMLSPAEVGRRLHSLLPPGGEGEVAFYGGSFTLLADDLQEAYLRACRPFIEARRLAGVRVSTRPDALDLPICRSLRLRGVTTVEIGCQSFSAEVLSRSGRGHGPDAAAEAVGRLRGQGLRIGLQLMPGLPGGGYEEAIGSLHRALALAPDFLRIYPAVVFTRTSLAESFLQGQFRPLDLDQAVEWVAEMVWICRRAGVPVIRTGLQETPDLAREVLAGPHHPAFGQLVRSRLWVKALESLGTGGTVTIAAVDHADALGHRRENLDRLAAMGLEFRFRPSRELPPSVLEVSDGRRFHLDDLINFSNRAA